MTIVIGGDAAGEVSSELHMQVREAGRTYKHSCRRTQLSSSKKDLTSECEQWPMWKDKLIELKMSSRTSKKRAETEQSEAGKNEQRCRLIT